MAGNQGTSQFLDRPAVIAAVGRARARVLARSAGYVRTVARRSLRRRKQPAAPGQPPSVHSTDAVANLKNIQFGWDASAEKMICGPVGLSQYRPAIADKSTGSIPGRLEHGSTLRLLTAYSASRPEGYQPTTQSQLAAAESVRTRAVRLAARPFMSPALRVSQPKLVEFWKGQVTG